MCRLGLALVLAAASWWAWREYRARPPAGLLRGAADVPPPPDTAHVTAAPPRTGTVARLPRGSRRVQGARRRGSTRTGPGTRVEAEGAMAWMTGAHAVVFDVDRGLAVTVGAAVAAGRLRVYLGDGAGYRYAEAVPGAPLRLSGPLVTGTSEYFFYAEAVGGRVEGVAWSVSGG